MCWSFPLLFLSLTRVSKVLGNNVFVFEFPNATDAKGWLTGFDINREWALRYSGMFHPTGTCAVYCDELDGKWRVNKRYMNPPMTSFENVHADPLSEGDLEKLGGSKLEGRFQARRIRLADGGKKLEYLQDSDVKGEVPMEKAQVVVVCNDVLTKSKAKKTPKLVEAMEHVNWFGVVGDSEDRVFIFRSQSSEICERWVVSLAKHATVYGNSLQGLVLTKQEMYKKSTKKRKLMYKGHPLPETSYPVLDRGGTSSMDVGEAEEPPASKSPRSSSVAVPAARSPRAPPASSSPRQTGSFREPSSSTNASSSVAATSAARRSMGRQGSSPSLAAEEPPATKPLNRSLGRAAGNAVKLDAGGASDRQPSRGRGQRSGSKPGLLDEEDPPSAPAAAEPEPTSAYARLRTATLSAKAKKAAREEMLEVKKGGAAGGGGPPRPVMTEAPRDLKQDAAAAREKERLKKAQERRQKLEQQRKLREKGGGGGGEGGDDEGTTPRSGGGGSSPRQEAEIQRLRAEVEQLRVELEDERAAHARMDASLAEMREKAEADKNNARLLKQLARDFKAQAEQGKAQIEEMQAQLDQAQQREQELQDQFERDLQQAKADARHEAEGGNGGGVSEAEYEEMAARLDALQQQLDKAKSDLKAQAREMREQTLALEKAETLTKQLQEERQLLVDELEESNKMQQAVEDILDLGRPVRQLHGLDVALIVQKARNLIVGH